jgi:hypothetical protein
MEPTVRALLLPKVDELVGNATGILAEIRTVTEQLEPERARSCRNALTMADVMIDEIRLRAYAGPWTTPTSEHPACRPDGATTSGSLRRC